MYSISCKINENIHKCQNKRFKSSALEKGMLLEDFGQFPILSDCLSKVCKSTKYIGIYLFLDIQKSTCYHVRAKIMLSVEPGTVNVYVI